MEWPPYEYPQASEETPRSLADAGDLRLLAVLNPYSSNYRKAITQFDKLRHLGFAAAADYIETGPTCHETAGVLGDKLTGSTNYHAVITLTGDGGSNTIGQSLHRSGDSRLENTPVIFGRGGGACDLHAMTLGNTKDYLSQLPGSPIRPLLPLHIEASSLDDAWRRQETVFGHGGAGDLGVVSKSLNGQGHRGSKLLGKPFFHEIQEAVTAVKAISQFRRFYVSDMPGGEQQLISGIALTNGQQMGRRRPFPGNIFEPGYHQLISPSLPAFIGNVLRMYAGSTKIMAQRIDSNFYITAQHPGDAIPIMYDGETFNLPTRSRSMQPDACPTNRVSIETSDQPLLVVANRG